MEMRGFRLAASLKRVRQPSLMPWRSMSDSHPALAELGDTVKIHYKGMLEDGRIFHNTLKSKDGEWERGHPVYVYREGQIIQIDRFTHMQTHTVS